MTVFSIIICTCNPAPHTLEKVLNACLSQNFESEKFEIILVDNNSSPPLVENVSLLKRITSGSIRVIEEKKQGLAYARITGSEASVSSTLVFVDDDNILEADYLEKLSQLQLKHPEVAAWGPGIIKVKFTGEVAGWVKKNYAWLFQQKNRTETQYGSVAAWPDYYPAGSGLSVTREIMKNYTLAFERGDLSMTGRKGNVLSSAEDTQIVWTAVKMGKAAGTSPDLKLTHVIPATRTSLRYLKALNYGIAHSYASALREMFPEKTLTLKKRSVAGKINFMFKMLMKARFMPLAFYRFYSVENSWYRAIERLQ